MNGSRKVEMLKRVQWLSFCMTMVFMCLKAFLKDGAPGLTTEMLVTGLGGVGINFWSFVSGNIKEHQAGASGKPPSA
jgi:hypothetical protein